MLTSSARSVQYWSLMFSIFSLGMKICHGEKTKESNLRINPKKKIQAFVASIRASHFHKLDITKEHRIHQLVQIKFSFLFSDSSHE